MDLLDIYYRAAQAIEYSLHFYEKHGMFINPDGVVGIQVLLGEVDYILLIGYKRIPPSLYRQLRSWRKRARSLLNTIIPHIKEKEKAYYEQVGHLIETPFTAFGDGIMSYKVTETALMWDANDSNHPEFNETQSDECMNEFKPQKDAKRESTSCKLSNQCVKRMLLQSNTQSYSISHQALYVHFIRQFRCIPLVNTILKYMHKSSSLSIVERTLCSNMFNQMMRHLREYNGYFSCTERDVFSEYIFICGSLGYLEFINLTFLDHILSWQRPELGCFKEVTSTSNSAVSQLGKCRLGLPSFIGPNRASSRKLKVDIMMEDGCSVHFTSTALSALVVHLRLFFDRYMSSYNPSSSKVYETFSKVYMETRNKKFLPAVQETPTLSEKEETVKDIVFIPSFLPFNLYQKFKEIMSQL